jgi:threonine/homoserine/homoserine lactone efflux protein
MVDPLPYAAYSFVMSITPGPNNIMLTAAGASFGSRRTLPHMLGITVGVAIQTVAVSTGLGALFSQWPEIQTVLRWAGALYLVYLGWRMLRVGETRATEAGRPVTFGEAAISQFLNPKAWVMTLTAASLFLPRDIGLLSAGSYMVAVMSVVNLPCIAAWALFGSSLRVLLARPASRLAFNVTMALALATTGIIMLM